MKLFEIPMVVASLLGFCFLPDSYTPAARAAFTFGEQVNLGPIVNSPQSDGAPCFSPDGLELYFASNRPGGYGSYDIWMSKRASTEDPWGPPVNLGPGINSASEDWATSMSSDGLTLYLHSPNVYWNDLYTATRPTKDAPWGPRVNMGPPISLPDVSSTLHMNLDYVGIISPDDLELFFASWREGGIGMTDIYVTTRATPSDPWGPPVNLGPTINTSGRDFPLTVSTDGLVLFIGSDNRPGGFGGWDTWMTRRPYKGAAWSEPVNLGPSINTPRGELSGVSRDGKWASYQEVIYNGAAVADADLTMVPIIPIVDFNGDGIVAIEDLVRLIESWGKDDPSVDIGPMPWGDGKIDGADLEVLMSYWQQEILPPELIAYWKLDEAEGSIAVDSAGGNDATLSGQPLWQPEGGQKAGALQLDGVDDYMSTAFVLNPADGPFSVLVWILGGAPGQAVLSQANGSNWLRLDSVEGCPMTELKSSGRSAAGGPLLSEAIVADGTWHRIGLVWDGSYRHLHVDGVEVAKDATPLSNLASAEGGLYFGAGSGLEPGSFFSGLIDDVRIYNRAVKSAGN